MNKVSEINEHLEQSSISLFLVRSISQEDQSLTVSMDAEAGGPHENETFEIKFNGVDSFSLPMSFQGELMILDTEVIGESVVNTIGLDLSELLNEGLNLYTLNFSSNEKTNFFIVAENLEAEVKVDRGR